MKRSLNFKKYKFLLISFFFLFIAFSINNTLSKPKIIISKQDATWNINNDTVIKFHFGFRRLESALLWISTILESDIDHYKKRDLNSWMFLRFNTISKLDPRFYQNYSYGSLYLSIIKDDISGASILYDKGLEHFPDDYYLLRDATFHFYFEAKDYKRAFIVGQQFKRYHPEHYKLISVIAKLDAENGNLETALKSLNVYQIEHPEGDDIGNKIHENRYALRAEIDLNCLNNLKSKDCIREDLDGKPYRQSSAGYVAEKKWVPFRVK